ncbi:hypothetical protein [Saccharomonospora saliphila]|uniref:hypothetical protein n=1 Tax=Saccharomonospora saliphila TaxID=369829 RepID=UPI00036F5DC9|nr:hypothetical protein [Saccharomonospora saliphila]
MSEVDGEPGAGAAGTGGARSGVPTGEHARTRPEPDTTRTALSDIPAPEAPGPEADTRKADTPEAEARAEHARSVHALAAAMLRWGMSLAVPTSLITVAIATLLGGEPGLAGAAFGVVLGFGSALVTLTMMRLAAQRSVNSLLGFALGGYAVKMTLLLLVMLLLDGVATVSGPALAFGMLATVVAWAAAEVVAFLRTRTPTLVVPSLDAYRVRHTED